MKLFVHIPKNGGMSIRHALKDEITLACAGRHVSDEYTVRLQMTMEAAGEHHGNEHARWRDFRADLRQAYRAFAVVRNPWSRTVSRYTFACLAAQRGLHKLPPRYTFERFLEERHEYGGRTFYWHRAIHGWFPQKDYVVDEAGVLRCDCLRLEHLTDDVKAYTGRRLPRRRNISNIKKLDYRDFYSEVTAGIVAEWYAEDIEYFGFSFDGPATRNTWCATA